MGKVWRKVVVARFARALGTLVAGGVPILEALRIAGQAAANRTYIRAAGELEERVKGGETISSAMPRLRPVSAGAHPHYGRGGEKPATCRGCCCAWLKTLDNESEIAMKRLTTMIEPVIVLFMGGFVGFVVLSILLPVFEANSIVK